MSLSRLLAQAEQAREARVGVSIENRIKDVQRRAKAKRLRVNGDLHVIRHQVKRGKMESALAKLAGIEAVLDGVAHEVTA
jgi:hypothetical protein